MISFLEFALAGIGLQLVVQILLGRLNMRELARHRGKLPPAFSEMMDAETYRRAGDYSWAKLRLARWEHIWEAGVLVLVFASGVLPWFWELWTGWWGGGAWAGAGFLVACMLGLSVPGLPWEWWAQFRLEAHFGFNRSTLGLWLSDRLKGALLSVVLGVPLLWLLIVVVERGGALWWLWGWLALTSIKLVLAVVIPWWVLPLFNKFTPLEDAGLRERLMGLADRGGFAAGSIHVMDGSRRSTHANALFTGFGRFRRIVLFDTLLAKCGAEELEAVLAHEIGHYRRGHIWKGLLLGGVLSLAGFFVLGWLRQTSAFFTDFGFEGGATAPAFLLFALLAGVVGFWFQPLGNALSRKHEYEADDFARRLVGSSGPLVRALRGLARDNLANLTPHPAYSTFYYSHPTLAERFAALERAEAAGGGR